MHTREFFLFFSFLLGGGVMGCGVEFFFLPRLFPLREFFFDFVQERRGLHM